MSRNLRFDGLSDTIEYYEYLVKDCGHTLSEEQREDLRGVASMIVCFGEAGESYYTLAMELLGEA